MISRITYLRELRHELLHYKSNALKEFYYLESEDLRYKKDPGKWNIIEIFEHMNLTNHHYLKVLSEAVQRAPEAESDQFALSWLGKRSIRMMRPDDEGNLSMKMPTFRSIDPLRVQRKGQVLVDKVVFQDFIDGIEGLIQVAEGMERKAIDKMMVKTLFPLLKLPMGDALGFVTAHTARHIVQANRLAEELK